MPIKKTVMNKTDIYGIETCSYVYRDVGRNATKPSETNGIHRD